MPQTRFNSISFAPYRARQSPLTHDYPSRAEIAEDVSLLASQTRSLRTYSSLESGEDIAELADAHGLKIWQGIWLGADRARNDREIARGIDIARRFPDTVDRLVVGNEVLLRHDLPFDELAADLDRVRIAVRQKVTYADVWEFWEKFPALAAHVDIVTIHILPYWEDQPTGLNGAMAHVREIYRRIKSRFPAKPIAIGETGWPSRGRWRRQAAPGLVNQAVFLRRFVALAQQESFDYNIIEAFDQVWKYHNEGTVGANWGLWTADRQPKFPLHGPLVENPRWPLAALLSILLSLLLLAPPLAAATPRLPTSTQLQLALLATALGNALGFAWCATTPILYDTNIRLTAVANLAGQSLLAGLLMQRASARLIGRPPIAGQSEAGIRARFRLRLPSDGTTIFADLTRVFAWTAAVQQLRLVFDPRYRDFPLASFSVPLACIVARALLRDLPRHGGGREGFALGLTLVIGAITSAVIEGPTNLQSLAWNAAVLILAAPLLLACVAPAPT